MSTYYDLLNVDAESDAGEIKRAFRRKAKELHPDVISAKGRENSGRMRTLIEAYETLLDAKRRQQYNRLHAITPGQYHFDYRRFLREQEDDMVSQSKLIFYDLLHDWDDEALELYDHNFRYGRSDMANYMNRGDFMDCAFLLAEAYYKQGHSIEACRLLMRIARYEMSKPYFRHFFVEIIQRIRTLVCKVMLGAVSDELMLDLLYELIEIDLAPEETAIYYRKAAELHRARDEHLAALRCLRLSEELTPLRKRQRQEYAVLPLG